ncbi:SPL family radical SAM protein [Effusibacillus dendaii]|uniref:Radical SAM core domain-containing protein n=1 Tax=Effusibacillus dendaii TaxID=2743772 RepID=A0A7I8DG80_9BACL|nr:radical SAM protein [Effusibacillus dendaii]BCJ87580.1 hypothetical protein skT53_25650 [Effusibacillus dendaii]
MKITIEHKIPTRVLTPASGYLTEYSHTLNPYVGCTFACSYCYVRRMPVALFRGSPWGSWVDVKQNAADHLRTELKRANQKGPVTIFLSSSTDPYQPVEYREKITRSFLEVLAENPPAFLFVQTRSPLVVRDIDLFCQLKNRIRISLTIETDRDDVRRAFAPLSPSIPARLSALKRLTAAGVPTQAAVSPLLPCTPAFPKTLSAVTSRVCIDDFFRGDGSGGKRTEQLGIRQIFHQNGWDEWYDKEAYTRLIADFQRDFKGQIYLSQTGFLPESV